MGSTAYGGISFNLFGSEMEFFFFIGQLCAWASKVSCKSSNPALSPALRIL